MVRALVSHQCGPGSNPGSDTICGLSLLLVLSFAPRGFSPGTPVFPSPQKPIFPNSNSTRNQVDEEPLNVDVLPPNQYLFNYVGRDTAIQKLQNLLRPDGVSGNPISYMYKYSSL